MKTLKAEAERVVREFVASQPKPPIEIATCTSEFWEEWFERESSRLSQTSPFFKSSRR